MPNSITNRQMIFIIFLTLTSVTMITIPKVAAESAGTGAWVPIMAAAVIFGLFAAVLASLNNMFQGKILFEYSAKITGKFMAYVFAAFYLIYFFSVSVSLNIELTSILKANFLLKTPQWITLAASLAVCGYAAFKGISNVARLFEIYGVIFVLTLVFLHMIMFFQGHLIHILPLYDPSEAGKYFGAVKDMIFPFLGIEILTVIPFTAKNSRKSLPVLLTVLAVGLIYVFVVETSYMMIGPDELVFHRYAMIAVIRQVEMPYIVFLNRVDLIYILVGLMGIHAGITIVYMAATEYVCRMFAKLKRAWVSVAIGALILVTALIMFEIDNFNDVLQTIISYAGLIAAGLIPCALLITAKVKKHAGKI